ncbi:MAG TPA: response regulator [Coleofasciculaceae cyanobacterium]
MSKILVVEDDRFILENLTEILEALNYEATPAATAKEAVSILQSNTDFNLILSDIMTPDGDGFDVLSFVRSNPITASIPFIFLTAKTQMKDMRLAMVEGADDYLTKPFTIQEVEESIKSRLNRAEVNSNQAKLALSKTLESFIMPKFWNLIEQAEALVLKNSSDREGLSLIKELQMMRLTLDKFKLWLEK